MWAEKGHKKSTSRSAATRRHAAQPTLGPYGTALVFGFLFFYRRCVPTGQIIGGGRLQSRTRSATCSNAVAGFGCCSRPI